MSGAKYAQLFKEYREKHYCNDKRVWSEMELFISIEKLFEAYDSGNEFALSDYFSNNKHPRPKAKLIIEDFNRYLRDQGKKEFDASGIAGVKFYNSSEERHLVVMREMHEPLTSAEIGEKTKLDADTIREYIKDFENGFSFLGTDMTGNIRSEKRKKRFRSTIHPVFLALNASELNMLMLYLQQSENKEIMRIGNLIYSQMTNYAREVICPKVTKFKDIELSYSDEYDNLQENAVGFLLKMGREPVNFYFIDDNGNKVFDKGRIVDLIGENIKIITEDQRELLLPEDEIHVTTDMRTIYRQ